MKRNPFLAMLFAAVLVLLQSCNFPQPALSANAATATALAGTQQGIPVTGATGTPAQAILSVNSSSYCRTGPGSAYGLVATLNPGAGFLVIGKFSSGNFWIIANPAGGACWVSGRSAVVAGDTSRLPEYPAPPRPTAAPGATPAVGATPTSNAGALPAPASLNATRVCARGSHGRVKIWVEDIMLTWQPSGGQAGYRLYADNQALTPAPANATSVNIQLTYAQSGPPTPHTLGVEAYNDSNTSPRASVIVAGCP